MRDKTDLKLTTVKILLKIEKMDLEFEVPSIIQDGRSMTKISHSGMPAVIEERFDRIHSRWRKLLSSYV